MQPTVVEPQTNQTNHRPILQPDHELPEHATNMPISVAQQADKPNLGRAFTEQLPKGKRHVALFLVTTIVVYVVLVGAYYATAVLGKI